MAEKKQVQKIPDDYWKHCPGGIPEGLIPWIEKTVIPHDNVILYKKGNVRGRCYICGAEISSKDNRVLNSLGKFYQGYRAICPECGAECKCVLENGSGWLADSIANVGTVQLGDDGSIWCRQWNIVRGDAPGLNGNALSEIARYCVTNSEGGWKAAKWVLEWKWSSSMMSTNYHRVSYPSWKRDQKIVRIYDGVDYFYIPDNWESITKNTPLEFVRIRDMVANVDFGGNPIRWVLDFGRYPVLEKLYNAGYMQIVSSVEGYIGGNDVNVRAKKIQDALHLPLWMLKTMEPGQWSVRDIERLRPAFDLYKKKLIRKEDIPVIVESGVNVKDISLAIGHAPIQKIISYLQMLEEKNITRYGSGSAYYRDYLEMCEKCGEDLNSRQVLFPTDLVSAHDKMTKLLKFKENEILSEGVSKRAKALSKYCFENDKYLIRPAGSYKEMFEEGNALHHCVATYAKRVSEGSTAIFFIRKKDAPDESYYTLEYCSGKVVQCRTLRNESYELNPEIKKFVELWLKTITAKKRKKVA